MKYRLPILLGGVTAILLAVALALGVMARTGRSEEVPSDESDVSLNLANSPSDAALEEGVRSIAIAEAGKVVVREVDGRLSVLSTTPNPGWASAVQSVTAQDLQGIFWNRKKAVRYVLGLDASELSISIEPWESATPLTASAGVPPVSSDSTVGQAIITSTTAQPPASAPPVTTSATTTTTRPVATTVTTSTTTTTAAPTTTTTTTAPTTTTTQPATTTTAPPAPAWTAVAIDSPGGSIIVSYQPGQVRLGSATPAEGFVLDEVEERRSRVDVRFKGDDVSYRLRAEWRDGALFTDVDESAND